MAQLPAHALAAGGKAHDDALSVALVDVVEALGDATADRLAALAGGVLTQAQRAVVQLVLWTLGALAALVTWASATTALALWVSARQSAVVTVLVVGAVHALAAIVLGAVAWIQSRGRNP